MVRDKPGTGGGGEGGAASASAAHASKSISPVSMEPGSKSISPVSMEPGGKSSSPVSMEPGSSFGTHSLFMPARRGQLPLPLTQPLPPPLLPLGSYILPQAVPLP